MQRTPFITVLIAPLAAALALAATQPASAEDRVPSARVSLADLDLSTPAGADEALSRLRRAAREVCNVHPGPKTIDEALQDRACTRDALSRAVTQLASAGVATRFAQTHDAGVAER